MRSVCACLTLLALLAGCGTSDDEDQVRGVVARFLEAVRTEGGAEEACTQLSAATVKALESQTQQSCRGVIGRFVYDGEEIASADVFITNAKVDLRDGDTMFLSREPTGWKLTAIACKPEQGKPRDRPFDCEVES